MYEVRVVSRGIGETEFDGAKTSNRRRLAKRFLRSKEVVIEDTITFELDDLLELAIKHGYVETVSVPTSILTNAEVSQYVQEIEDLRTQGDDETADAMEEWLGQTLGFEDGTETETAAVSHTESPTHHLHMSTSTSSPIIDTAALAALFEE